MTYEILNLAAGVHGGLWLRVPDNSMAPTMLADDSILVEEADPDTVDLDGGVYLIEVDGVPSVRRVFEEPLGGLRVTPDNRAEFAERRFPAWADAVAILGRVTRKQGAVL